MLTNSQALYMAMLSSIGFRFIGFLGLVGLPVDRRVMQSWKLRPGPWDKSAGFSNLLLLAGIWTGLRRSFSDKESPSINRHRAAGETDTA